MVLGPGPRLRARRIRVLDRLREAALRADIQRFALGDPGDVSGLRAAIDAGTLDPATIVAVIGKTHGNGLVNDYTRGYLALSLSSLIGERLGKSAASVRARVPFVFSGGVEGVLSPHYTAFSVLPGDAPTDWAGAALAVGIAQTPPIRPSEVGRQAQIAAVAEAVGRARSQAGIAPEDVHFVQVKGPAFALADIRRDGAALSDDPGKLMGYGRAAGALGVALALGELDATEATEATLLRDFTKFSSVASISAGIEVVMLDDGDIDQQRHIRGAVGAIVASVLNDTALFVSGGAEHQGPDGGGIVAVIVERVA